MRTARVASPSLLTTLLTAACLLFAGSPAHAQEAAATAAAASPAPVHALALHGAPKYPASFDHLDYVNPDAPKGGALRQHVVGTFDSLNPYIVKGNAAAGSGLVTETLLEQSSDEPFTGYGLLAESIEVPEDRSWVIFTLRPQAKWHDGKPVTAEDVVWSFDALTKNAEASPFFKAYYTNVKGVEALSDRKVKFSFDMAGNRELPLIVGQMPILPKHYWTAPGHDFTKTTLEPMLGSGPYKIAKVDPGKTVTFERVKDWWGKDLPINRGRYNFDTLTYVYYLDGTVALEAFFGGQYDMRLENVAKQWATAYDVPQIKDGRITKAVIENDLPQGIQGFVYNTRRPVFADRRVREALANAFDFEWSNAQFAYGAYKRSRSYFSNSDMEATGLPEGAELALLEKFRDKLPPEIFTQSYAPPQTDGSGNLRANLRRAMELLDQAGYRLGPDGVRVHAESGQRLEFEFIDSNPAFERWISPFIRNLQKLGVKATYRTLDDAQMQNRLKSFDFDMTVAVFGQSSSPGNEQRDYWSSASADQQGGRNLIGIKDPVVDALIDEIVASPTREDLVTRCRALDRVLQWGHYMVPNWHLPAWRIAYWNSLAHPDKNPPYALPVETVWWSKDSATQQKPAQ